MAISEKVLSTKMRLCHIVEVTFNLLMIKTNIKHFISNNYVQIIKYYIAAALGAFLDFFIFNMIIINTHFFYQIANIISYSISVSITYYLQKKWTFKSKKNHINTIKKFILALLFTYFFSSILLYLSIGAMNLDPSLSKIIQILLSSLLGYVLNKWYIFK